MFSSSNDAVTLALASSMTCVVNVYAARAGGAAYPASAMVASS